MTRNAKLYYRNVKRIVSFSSKDKKQFLQLLKKKLIEFSEQQNNCSYQDMINHFGTPNEVASSYIESLDTDILLKHLKFKKFIKILVAVLCISILSYTCFEIYTLNCLYESAKESLNLHEETTIVEIE